MIDSSKIYSNTKSLDRLFNKYESLIYELIKKNSLPLHIYFEEEIEKFVKGFFQVKEKYYDNLQISFAIKSNPCSGAIKSVAKMGMGSDCASEYEFLASLQAGISPEDITCNGNAKTNRYIKLAVENGAILVVDNIDEWNVLHDICIELNKKANILIRFKGMDLSGLTADDQSTAANWTKFGFHIENAKEIFKLIKNCDEVNFLGLSAHIGTQLCKPHGFTKLFESMFELIDLASSYLLDVKTLNIGGGFPVEFMDRDNSNEFKQRVFKATKFNDKDLSLTWNNLSYGFSHINLKNNDDESWRGKQYWSDFPASKMLEYVLNTPMKDNVTPLEKLKKYNNPRLIVEPGRSIFAPSGITISEVMGTKKVLNHDLVTLDMGINNHSTNLIAPDIFPAFVIDNREDDSLCEAFLAGRLCFSGDMISKNKVKLNRLPKRGELVLIYFTGAYSADHFASNSCGYPLPAKVAILKNGDVELWRKKQEYKDVFE